MAKFILRNRDTGTLVPVKLTPEQVRLLAFLVELNLDLSGFDATEIIDDFQEV